MRHIVMLIVLSGFAATSFAKELLYLGHTSEIRVVRKCGNYLLSRDIDSNWILWDYAKKQPIISGTDYNVDMRGNSLVVGKSKTSQIYHLPDLNPITVPLVNVRLTANGEYLLSDSAGVLKVWDLNGDLKGTRPVNYNNDLIILTDNRLLITAKGSDSIVSYPFPSFENPLTIKFTGKFICWMKDGETFLSLQGDTAFLCGITGTRKAVLNRMGSQVVDGYGQYFWRIDPQEGYSSSAIIYNVEKGDTIVDQIGFGIRSFKIGAYTGNIPYYTNLNLGPSGCGGLYGVPLVFYKFTSDSICSNMHNNVNFNLKGFDCDSAGNWVGGNEDGLVFCGKADDTAAFTCFNLGKIRSIHGTPDSKMAIATSTGKIMTYDISSGNFTALDTIDQASSKISMSIDGTKLFALSYVCMSGIRADSSTLTEYAFPTNQVINRWGFPNTFSNWVAGFNISDDGNVIGSTISSIQGKISHQNSLLHIGSGKIIGLPDDYGGIPLPSPSGRFSAIQCDTLVKIYRDDSSVTSLKGRLGGWLDDSSLIINQYSMACPGSGACALYWQASAIFKVNGDSVQGYKLPEMMMNTYMVSDSTVFYSTGGTKINSWDFNTFRLANIRQGTILCTIADSTQPHGPAFPVGPDYIVYQSDTALELVSWHDLVEVAKSVPAKTGGQTVRARFSVAGNKIYADFTIPARESPIFSMFSLRGELLARTTLGSFGPGSYRIEIPASALSSVKHPGKVACVAVLKVGATTVAKKVLW